MCEGRAEDWMGYHIQSDHPGGNELGLPDVAFEESNAAEPGKESCLVSKRLRRRGHTRSAEIKTYFSSCLFTSVRAAVLFPHFLGPLTSVTDESTEPISSMEEVHVGGRVKISVSRLGSCTC